VDPRAAYTHEMARARSQASSPPRPARLTQFYPTKMLVSRLGLVGRRSCTCTPRLTASLTLGSRSISTAPAPTLHPSESGLRPPHLLTLADLSVGQIQSLISSAIAFKRHYKSNAIPLAGRLPGDTKADQVETSPQIAEKTLNHKTVALMFSKRSTRTRVASESAVQLLGGFASRFVIVGSGN
jgi:ornithine carbamoyltransferase